MNLIGERSTWYMPSTRWVLGATNAARATLRLRLPPAARTRLAPCPRPAVSISSAPPTQAGKLERGLFVGKVAELCGREKLKALIGLGAPAAAASTSSAGVPPSTGGGGSGACGAAASAAFVGRGVGNAGVGGSSAGSIGTDAGAAGGGNAAPAGVGGAISSSGGGSGGQQLPSIRNLVDLAKADAELRSKLDASAWSKVDTMHAQYQANMLAKHAFVTALSALCGKEKLKALVLGRAELRGGGGGGASSTAEKHSAAAAATSTSSSAVNPTDTMKELNRALEQAQTRCDEVHRKADFQKTAAQDAHRKLMRGLEPQRDELNAQMHQLREQMEALRGSICRVDAQITDSEARVRDAEAAAAALKRQADECEEKDSEWAENMASAPEASQALWGRALAMLRCHKDGVPSLLGLSVISATKYRVPTDHVVTGLKRYIDGLTRWVEPRLADAAKKAEEERRRADLQAARKAALEVERSKALADVEHYQAIIRDYFPHAVSNLPGPANAGLSEPDRLAFERNRLELTKELLTSLRLEQITKSDDGQDRAAEDIEPDQLCCSIYKKLFRHPLTGPCGHSFESGAIKSWTKRKRQGSCPLCRAPLVKEELHLNVGLQAQAKEWRTTSEKLRRAAGRKRARHSESDGTPQVRRTSRPTKISVPVDLWRPREPSLQVDLALCSERKAAAANGSGAGSSTDAMASITGQVSLECSDAGEMAEEDSEWDGDDHDDDCDDDEDGGGGGEEEEAALPIRQRPRLTATDGEL